MFKNNWIPEKRSIIYKNNFLTAKNNIKILQEIKIKWNIEIGKHIGNHFLLKFFSFFLSLSMYLTFVAHSTKKKGSMLKNQSSIQVKSLEKVKKKKKIPKKRGQIEASSPVNFEEPEVEAHECPLIICFQLTPRQSYRLSLHYQSTKFFFFFLASTCQFFSMLKKKREYLQLNRYDHCLLSINKRENKSGRTVIGFRYLSHVPLSIIRIYFI